jgi:hypothetical protein
MLECNARAAISSNFPVRFLLICLLGLIAIPVWAAPARVEGTLMQIRNGETVRAKIWFEAPARMRLEIERDEALGVDAQIVVANGDDTRLWIPATKRLRRLGFNITQKWWRGWNLTSGGAANFALVGAAAGTITETEGAFLRRDDVLFGGGGGEAYYAASKSAARRFPREITVSPTSRIEKSDAGREVSRATIEIKNEMPVARHS